MKNKLLKVLFLGLVVLFISILFSCTSDLSDSEKPGAQLWGENCGRCHNIRPPSTLTDAQWDVAVLHMRTRANLTETEAEKIVTFLKAGN